jgi:hypothetical protein
MGLGILSPQTATAQIGQDYDQEQTNLEMHAEKSGAMPFGLISPQTPQLPGLPE